MAATSRWRAVNARAWRILRARCCETPPPSLRRVPVIGLSRCICHRETPMWMAVLKLVPWGDLIKATPQILQAAKRLWGRARKDSAVAAQEGAVPPADAQWQHLHDRVTQLEHGQRDGALLIESLAAQNAQLVLAIEALRRHSQRSTWALLTLGVLGLGLLLLALLFR